MLQVVFRNNTKQKAPGRIFFEKILETAVQELKLKSKISISVNLVGEAKIRELNKKYLKKDKPTDVLSFPLEQDPSAISPARGTGRHQPSADFGDIFICLSIAKNEAKRENISVDEKLAQLTVHGFLHLLGYDHEKSEEDEKEMFNLEDKILEKLN